MSIDKKTAVAYMCSSCGEYSFFSLNAFVFSGSRKQKLECSCKGSQLEITKNTTKTFKLDMDCPICMEKHAFTVSQSQFWSGKPLIFSCPFYEANILFIGEADRIEQCVTEYINEELQQIKNESPAKGMDLELLYNTCKSIHLLDKEKDCFQICSCEEPDLTLAYNDCDIYIICKSCHKCKPIPLDEVDNFLKTLENK